MIAGSPPATVVAGQSYRFTPTASDPNGNTLSFVATNLPNWASFSTVTGTISGTPGSAAVATYNNIVISVSDGTASASLPGFSIEVQAPPNRAPTITGSPATTATVGAAYSFQPSASDADGNSLTYSISNRPSWASFSTSTGRLSGTPAAGNVGSFTGIVISVTDGTATTSLPGFAITVAAPANVAPTISGTPPATVVAGAAYSFTPTAADSNGNTLTFSVTNLPTWATFSTTTGRISGTPTTGNVGAYENIVISVSDGTSSVSLAPATITVTAPVTGSAALSWVPPTENEDGTPLVNLAGYRIYYGTSAGSLTNVVTIDGATTTSRVISNLAQGTWYFGIRAFTSAGTESAMSGVASKTI